VKLPFRDTGFYEGFKSLDNEDIEAVKSNIKILLEAEKYTALN